MVRCVSRELTVFMGTLIVASMVSATPAFVKEPNDTVVMEGDTALLMCGVANLREGFEVRWESDRDGTFATNGTVLGKCLKDRVEPSRYSVVGDSTVGEFNLQIEGADATDADQYTCEIVDTINVRSVSSTQKVHLTVDSSPNGYYPKCRPSTLKNYYLEGDTLEAKCIFRNADQMPELKWYKSGKSLKGHRPYNSLADVIYEWPLSAADNGAKLTCKANETSTCDVGPVEIYFKPRPAMESTTVKVIVGEPAVFEVNGNWNPPQLLYSWTVNNIEVGENSPPRYYNNGSTLTISDTQPQDDNASVLCDVGNSVGNGRAHAKLRVLPAPMQTTSTKTTDTGVTQIGLLSTVSPLNDRPFSLLVIIVLAAGASMFLIAIAVVIFYFASANKKCAYSPKLYKLLIFLMNPLIILSSLFCGSHSMLLWSLNWFEFTYKTYQKPDT